MVRASALSTPCVGAAVPIIRLLTTPTPLALDVGVVEELTAAAAAAAPVVRDERLLRRAKSEKLIGADAFGVSNCLNGALAP